MVFGDAVASVGPYASVEADDINKQTVGLYIALKSKIESRAHYAPEPHATIIMTMMMMMMMNYLIN